MSSLITNIARAIHGKQGNKEWTSPNDFLINWDQTSSSTKKLVKKQTVEEMKIVMESIVTAFKGNKKVIKKKP
jgi:hypothetical protein